MATNKQNPSVIQRNGDRAKIFCQENYAQELYDRMFGDVVKKDINVGELLRVLDFKVTSEPNREYAAVCDNYLSLYFSFAKERKFFEILGLDSDKFYDWVISNEHVSYLKKNKVNIQVENVEVAKGSLYQAHLKTIIKDFREQIIKPTVAFHAKIVDKNQGGFLVEVQGIKAFLPGSLAAANKIVDFESYIGKVVPVMIEDYLKNSDIFVVSYKKYLEYILPSKLAELEKNQVMNGTVTGISKFGIFAEFDDIFTGLLHTAEMNEDTLERFKNGEIKSGQELTVWLKDIKSEDSKLILTETDPSQRMNEYETFRQNTEGNINSGTIISIKAHGALMEIEKGVLGLLPVKEMKKYKRRLEVGETLDIFIKKVDTATGKIYLMMTDEHAVTT